MTFAFDNTYARLPAQFHSAIAPTHVKAPKVIKVNHALADVLGLDAKMLESHEGAELLSGNAVPGGAEPIALAYAGHQFGNFVPQLGDGRAILLGEIVGKDGKRRDIQLKGAGRTRFSRGGDGRAALGPVLREYLVSEAMHAMGVPTTRALAAVTTGETIVREYMEPGAVLTRVAASHIRVGTFEFFAARGEDDALRTLSTYALERHYPDARGSGNDAQALLDCVIAAQAKLVAQWLGVGFIHGVMNTDNTSISGETIDYGPCAFLDAYDPKKRFSSIDHGGRYAFGNQPRIAHWNVTRLAEAILTLLGPDEDTAVKNATRSLERFPAIFDEAYSAVLRKKLGLHTTEDGDAALAADLFGRMVENNVDYTLFFRRLCASAASSDADAATAASFADAGAFRGWAEGWRARIGREKDVTPEGRAASMRHANPAFIPRNHRIAQLIDAAVDNDDYKPFEALLSVCTNPFEENTELAHLAEPPKPEERVLATFCGT